MRVHENLDLSEKKVKELQEMKKADAIKAITAFGLFNGHSTEYAKAQNLKIYEKINNVGDKKSSRSTNTPKHKVGDGANNS